MKTPCTISGAKHAWAWYKNGMVSKGASRPSGSTFSFSARGFYKCACGEKRTGVVKASEPGADLRDHLPGATP